MKVLVIGSGGREHTLAWKLRQSPLVQELYVAPGNAGTAATARNLSIGDTDTSGLLEFAQREAIDLTMVGPEAPLVAGIVDAFQAEGLNIVGPSAKAAQLEGSKAFAKEFMQRHGIPTAEFRIYSDNTLAQRDLRDRVFTFPVVVKADGLAAGKGVFICEDESAALASVASIMQERTFGDAGNSIIVEEFLRGKETSFIVLADGSRFVPLVSSRDHKAIGEGGTGPNTGGMGAFSTDELLTSNTRDRILREVIQPTLAGLAEEGTPFRGVLYAGLMLSSEGPKVLEYNVRFGDPETQVILPRLTSDLMELLMATAQGDLRGVEPTWTSEACVCVVVAAQGYPGEYPKGMEITGLEMAEETGNTIVFHAGTRVDNDRVLTSGGRVLGVTALAPSLDGAVMQAYEAVNKIHFEQMYYRRDIAS